MLKLGSKDRMTTSKHITPYQDLAMENVNKNSLKQLVSAILLSALEDADVEFLTDDYEEWKHYREKRKKKNEFFTEIEYQLEFRRKQEYKDILFDVCEITVHASDIHNEIPPAHSFIVPAVLFRVRSATTPKSSNSG